jgi:type I restriction enzyme S subunit
MSSIPSHWIKKKLKYVASLKSGDTITSDSITESGEYPVFGGNGIRGYTSAYTHCGKYVLIGRQGALCGNINYASGCFWASEHAVVVHIKGEDEVAWLGELLRSMDLNQYSQSAAQPGIAVDVIANIEIPVPPLHEQRAIADYLDRETARLDGLVAAKERVLGLLAEKRRAFITRAVTRGLDPRTPLRDSGIPWLGEIPAHWELKRAKWLFSQSALPVRDEDEMVTCFRDGQVTLRKNRREEGFTNAIQELGYQGIRVGQLVLHSMDAFAGAIGVSDSDGKCSPKYIICDPVGAEIINDYFGHLLRIMALNGFIQASCPAVRERAPRIRFPDFGEMFLPVPTRTEQAAIVAHITAAPTCAMRPTAWRVGSR